MVCYVVSPALHSAEANDVECATAPSSTEFLLACFPALWDCFLFIVLIRLERVGGEEIEVVELEKYFLWIFFFRASVWVGC